MKIDYLILTPSKMKIIVDRKTMSVNGEGTTEPKFHASRKSLLKWDPPNEKENISDALKKEIIQTIETISKRTKVPVIFD